MVSSNRNPNQNQEATRIDWIAVDWGSTHLRAFAMGSNGKPVAGIAPYQSDNGAGSLEATEFEPALIELVKPWLRPDACLPVVACGMVGSRQGWVEAAYRAVPCAAIGRPLTAAPCQSSRIHMHIIPGLSQDAPPDVIRGEETQIAGLLVLQPQFEGLICLPGTHTKWVRITKGHISYFSTFMTGELMHLLSELSVLRHSLAHSTGQDGWEEKEFLAGVQNSLDQPEGVARHLFSLRAEGLLRGSTGIALRSRLSGLLLGLEIKSMREEAGTEMHAQGHDLAIIGATTIAKVYQSVLAKVGLQARVLDVETVTLAGLTEARRLLHIT